MSDKGSGRYQIAIDGLELEGVIGINDWERLVRQKIKLDLVLDVAEPLSEIDDLGAPKIDYRALNLTIIELVEKSSFRLIEALANAICDVCLSYDGVRAVHLNVHKPLALRNSKSVGIKMYKQKGN